MTLHTTQSIVAKDTHRFRVVCCGRRWGKTTLAVYEMLGVAAAEDNRRVHYIAPTFQQARDIAWQDLKRAAGKLIVNANESRLELEVRTQRGGTSLILLRGWEALETLRGQRSDLEVLDEVSSMRNFWLGWYEVLRPMLADNQGHALFISTPKGFNSFYDLFNVESVGMPGGNGIPDPDFKSFRFTTYDNPHIEVVEVEKAHSELPEDQFAQEYLADFRKTKGLVYKDFDRAKHVYNPLDPTQGPKSRHQVLIGIDWGWTNPAAIVEIVKDADARYWVVSEWYHTGKTTEEIVEMGRSLHGDAYYPDPAEPDRIEILKRSGCTVRDVSKDVLAGIISIQTLIKSGRLMVSSACPNFIQEIEMYQWKEKKPGQNEPEEPVKEMDHALDAARYVIHMQSPAFARTSNVAKVFYPQFTPYANRHQR